MKDTSPDSHASDQDYARPLLEEGQLQQLLSSISDYIYLLESRNGGPWSKRYVSPHVEKLTGYPAHQFLGVGHLWTSLIHPDDLPDATNQFENFRHQIGGETEYRLRRADGAHIWVRDSARVVESKDGRLLVYGVVSDITARRRVEEELRRREEEYRLLVSSVSDYIYMNVMDSQGNWRSVNFTRQGAELTGYPTERFEDWGFWLSIIHRDDLQAATEQGERLARGESGEIEYRIWRADGTTIWVRDSARATKAPHGQVVVHGVISNITARKEAEEALLRSEERFRSLVQNGSDIISILEPDGTIRYESPAIERILGYDPAELIGQNVMTFIHTGDQPRVQRAMQEVLADSTGGSAPGIVSFRYRHRDGSWRILESTGTNLLRHPAVQGIVVNTRDITERELARQALDQSDRQMAAIFESITDAFFALDHHWLFTYLNPQAEQILDMRRDDLIGQAVWRMFPTTVGSTFRVAFQRAKRDQIKVEFEEFYAPLDIWLEVRVYPSEDGLSVYFRDVTARKMAESQLQRSAWYDPLTGLPNRSKFLGRLQNAIERSQRRTNYFFAVLFMDFDRFKTINDSLGHMVGDHLLVAIARRLEAQLRPGDMVARLGGDEFTILLDDMAGPGHATYIAERIQQSMAEPFILDGHEIFTAASIGIALSTDHYREPQELLRDADTAMYRAKAQGKARHVVFDSSMHTQALALLHLENDLRRAVEREEFQVHYQPVIDLSTGYICGFEALVRWLHPQRGLLFPAEFIPVAEETGLILPIGYVVLQESIAQLCRWRESHDITVSVNLSARQFAQSSLVQQVETLLSAGECSPSGLQLEISESVAMENVSSTATMLSAIRSLNVPVFIDDFGTGYSSLSYLHHFPLDALKVDRSFISRMTGNQRELEIVRTIVLLAHTLGLSVIAEGVETDAQLSAIRAMGCEFAQGFLISRPMTGRDATALLKANPRW